MKMKSFVMAASVAALAAGGAWAEGGKVKVGMITTLSGGGAGLGIDVRDGFMLATKMAGNENLEVVVEDDQRKPEIAVQLADKMIQSEKVDVLTGIIWSNLAMAVVPAATAQGKFYLALTLALRRWQAKAVTSFTSTSHGRTTTCMRQRALTPMTQGTRTPSCWRRTIQRARMR